MIRLGIGELKPSDMVTSKGIDDSCVTKYSVWKSGDGAISRIMSSTRLMAPMVVGDSGAPIG